MGYYVNLTDSNFGIPETKEVLGTLIEADLLFHNLKTGGSSSGEKWFSWVSQNYATEIKSVDDFFCGQLGFTTKIEDGKVWLTGYDSKTGQEDLFIALVAPYVEEGSFLAWEGEDGGFWEDVKIGDKLQTRQGKIIKEYEEFQEFRFQHFTTDQDNKLKIEELSYTEIAELSAPRQAVG
jgi:hypothetical protein